jgi:hypothetical protein
MRSICRILFDKPERKRPLERKERVVSKHKLNKEDVRMRTGLMWLRMTCSRTLRSK